MRTILIDGNNYLFAAQHSGSKLTAGEQEVTAVFGFLGSLRNVMERFPGCCPIVLWDGSPSWRVAEYPAYKANRDKNAKLVATKEALRNQRPLVKDLLEKLGVRQYMVQGQEADDIAGFLSESLVNAGHEVVLVTRDGDWQQLVRPGVIWFDHKKNKVINHLNFQTETGYTSPDAFLNGKAIQGDAGDNIPGVGGLGEGAAAVIMQHFSSLAECYRLWPTYKNTTYVTEKGSPWKMYRTKITRAFEDDKILERYNFNLKLMELRNRPRVPLVSTSLYNEGELKAAFAALGFHSLLRKFDAWMAPINNGYTVKGVTE